MQYLESQVADNGAAGAATITIPTPLGVQDGDLLFMVIGARGGTDAAVTTPTGWTLLRDSANGTTTRLTTFYRVANAEPPNYTVTLSTSQQAAGAISLYTPIFSVDVLSSGIGTSVSLLASNITTLYGYELAVAAYAHGTADVFANPPTDLNERFQVQSADAVGTNRVTIACYDAIVPKPKAWGGKLLTANISAAWAAHAIGFRSAASDIQSEILRHERAMGRSYT